MKRIATLLVLFTLAAAAVLAHGTDSHTILGTVTSLDGDTLAVTTTEGTVVTAELTSDTRYTRGTEKVSRDALTPGTRVSVKLTHDNKSVVLIRMAPGRSN
ncbi:MAG: hypothetical protein ABR524_10495 [Thermoanaerobaculia bacterium]